MSENISTLTGISIHARSPLWFNAVDFAQTLTEDISSYEHEITAEDGYKSASITFNGTKEAIEDWIKNGLGRDIKIFDKGGDKIWEGVVSELSANIGTLSISYGSLFDIGNRIVILYSRTMDDGEPPLGGGTFETPIAEDLESQARYGIIEKVISVGECTTAEAEQIRDTLIKEIAYPDISEDIDFSNMASPTITLTCTGYSMFLEAYIYNNESITFVTLKDKILAILAADPNALFSIDYTLIDDNALLTQHLEIDNRTAGTIIKSLVAQGDISNNRWLFAFYNDQQATYHVIPSEIAYAHRIAETILTLEFIGRGQIDPWDIKPGQWCYLQDFMVNAPPESTLRADPRYLFVERVNFTAPYGLRVSGGKVSTVKQLLARLGLGGM